MFINNFWMYKSKINNYLVIYTVLYGIIKMYIQTAKKYLTKSVGIWLKRRVLKV